jgi:hypothetical protein
VVPSLSGYGFSDKPTKAGFTFRIRDLWRSTVTGDLSRDEQKFLDTNESWQRTDGAYALIQGTRPYTLARGLNDSPTALAACSSRISAPSSVPCARTRAPTIDCWRISLALAPNIQPITFEAR